MAPKSNATPSRMLYCSFCRKSHLEVKKLIAGPGVFICDECVVLCQNIVRDTPDPDPANPAAFKSADQMDTEQLLGMIKGYDSAYSLVRGQMQEAVDILRQREVSWADIAAALDVSRQAAWERFS